MDKRDLELVVEHQRLTAQFLSLVRAGADQDSPDLVAVMAEMDRVGDELLSRLPPPVPIPMPQWLLDKYPNLFPSKRSRWPRTVVRRAQQVKTAYARMRGRLRRWWPNRRIAELWKRYQVLAHQAHALAESGAAPESPEVLALSAQIDRLAEEIIRRHR